MDKLSFENITKLTDDRINEWNELWDRSPDAHFFNSPDYFLAFLHAFNPKQYRIIFCYDKKELIAVLPLIKSRRFGITVWACPDRPQNFLDRTAFLISEGASKHIKEITQCAKKLGNVFLADCSEYITKVFLVSSKCLLGESIICPRTKIGDDTLSNMPAKQQRGMENRIKKNKQHLKFIYFHENLDCQLERIIEIEKNSPKTEKGITLFNHDDAKKLYRSIIETSPQNVAIGILYFDGLPVASIFGLISKNTFLNTHMAFRLDFGNLGPGKMLVYFTLEELRKNGTQIFDFSKGDGKLKREFTNEFPVQHNVYLPSNALAMIWWKLMIEGKRLAKLLLLRNRIPR